MRIIALLCLMAAGGMGSPARLWADSRPASAPAGGAASPEDVLTPQQWEMAGRSIEKALAWLASQQRDDGAFPTIETGQPAVTALCVLAFLSCGHLPGQGSYGALIDDGIEYVLSCQQSDGLLARHRPTMPMGTNNPSHTSEYNHAIAGLVLSEVYGMNPRAGSERMRKAIESALRHAAKRMPQPKRNPADKGAWRYGQQNGPGDGDLSATSWHLMFLRSATNAGFDLPSELIEDALRYVQGCYEPAHGRFVYALRRRAPSSRAMAGAGALSLSLAGRHQTDAARNTGEWLLQNPFDQYRVTVGGLDRFFYGAFYCSHAMFQLGGRYWAGFYPTLLRTLEANQRPDGSWDIESGHADGVFGNAYTTALAVLAISAPYQLLPVFQR